MQRLQQYLGSKGYDVNLSGVLNTKLCFALEKFIYDEFYKRKWIVPIKGLIFMRLDNTFNNKFNDYAVFTVKGKVFDVLHCSTTAGDYYVYNPLTVGGITGTAIACEQQVLQSHKFVTARDWNTLWLKAPYFQQVKPIDIWRDGNKNKIIDKIIKKRGMYGINIHQGGKGTVNWNWSAGCIIMPLEEWKRNVIQWLIDDYIDFNLIELL